MPLSFLECPPTPRVQKSVFSMDLSSPPPLPFQVKKSLEGSGSSYIVQELRPRPAFNRNAFRRLSSCPSESSETNRAMLSMEEILSRIKSSESSTLHRFFSGPRGSYTLWDDRFEELRAYKDENGHCKVPQKHPQHGKWVNNQRTELKKYKDDESLTGLQRERIDKLNSINFYWGRDNKKKS
ncbi:hypothetical protein ACHAWO_009042 [Cyclotella atomus]|uniref:Helicase-associated domain-containing protein n=1 Tax=Cyclotella atomus TaxID=382360 RepID=A0ABD3QXX9_9STRA